jgi:hypothetical protein
MVAISQHEEMRKLWKVKGHLKYLGVGYMEKW